MNRSETGRAGEDTACRYLEKKGYTVERRNYRAGRCEIDIIARDGEAYAFVEVKTRRNRAYGAGREAVTAQKQKNIIAAALLFLQAEGLEAVPCRFDVIEITGLGVGQRIEHIINAFDVEIDE